MGVRRRRSRRKGPFRSRPDAAADRSAADYKLEGFRVTSADGSKILSKFDSEGFVDEVWRSGYRAAEHDSKKWDRAHLGAVDVTKDEVSTLFHALNAYRMYCADKMIDALEMMDGKKDNRYFRHNSDVKAKVEALEVKLRSLFVPGKGGRRVRGFNRSNGTRKGASGVETGERPDVALEAPQGMEGGNGAGHDESATR
jgi:hypothetical protein